MKPEYVALVFKIVDGVMGIYHLCFYENEPQESDLADLRSELWNDPEFGLMYDQDYEILVFIREIIQKCLMISAII